MTPSVRGRLVVLTSVLLSAVFWGTPTFAQNLGPAPAFSQHKFPRHKVPVKRTNTTPTGESSATTPSAPMKVRLEPDVWFSLQAPSKWTPGKGEIADLTELNQIKGSKKVCDFLWSSDQGAQKGDRSELRLTCVGAPIDVWSSGAQGVVFERVNALVRRRLEKSASIDEYIVKPASMRESVAEQTYTFRGKEGGVKSSGGVRVLEDEGEEVKAREVSGSGKHLVGFSEKRVFVCSVQCLTIGRGPSCAPAVVSSSLAGKLIAEPSGGGLLRGFVSSSISVWPLILALIGVVALLGGIGSLARGLVLRAKQR